MHKGFITTAALLGALAVVLGAFGAHALKQRVGDGAAAIFETAVRYQFYHVFALMGTAILYRDFPRRLLRLAGIFFVAGMILFSGSLYFLTYSTAVELNGYRWIGAVTPVGGLSFIAGWVCLFAGVLKKD